MSQPYVGEIRMFAGNFAPAGWMFCDGQVLPISEFETLFQLIGTTYGGDGEETFALPDLRGRLPMGMGGSYMLAEPVGVEQVVLTTTQMPAHNHAMIVSNANASTSNPENNLLATSSSALMYRPIASLNVQMAASSVNQVGGSQPHSNMQPYLCISFIISLYGIFPSPT